MKALILAAMISTGGDVIGPGTTLRFMAQREGEPLIHVQTWDTIKCADAGKNVVIRIKSEQKALTVTCE